MKCTLISDLLSSSTNWTSCLDSSCCLQVAKPIYSEMLTEDSWISGYFRDPRLFSSSKQSRRIDSAVPFSQAIWILDFWKAGKLNQRIHSYRVCLAWYFLTPLKSLNLCYWACHIFCFRKISWPLVLISDQAFEQISCWALWSFLSFLFVSFEAQENSALWAEKEPLVKLTKLACHFEGVHNSDFRFLRHLSSHQMMR